MLKKILTLNGVNELSKKKLNSINGSGQNIYECVTTSGYSFITSLFLPSGAFYGGYTITKCLPYKEKIASEKGDYTMAGN